MADELPLHQDGVLFYLCMQVDCTRRLVSIKLHSTDSSTAALNGPGLAQALQALIVEKGLGERAQVCETSCLRGCRVGPRLNVVGTGGFKETVRYLHLPATRRGLRCFPWEEVVSVEALLDRSVEE
jgi:hypothetical protein